MDTCLLLYTEVYLIFAHHKIQTFFMHSNEILVIRQFSWENTRIRNLAKITFHLTSVLPEAQHLLTDKSHRQTFT